MTEEAALTRMFDIGALILLAIVFATVAINFVMGDSVRAIFGVAAAALLVWLVVAARRCRLHWVRSALPVVMTALLVVASLMGDGVHDDAFIAIAAPLVLAGVLMTTRVLIVFVALITVLLGVMGYAESAGLVHNTFGEVRNTGYLIGLWLSFVFIAALVRVLTVSLMGSLGDARRAQERLQLAVGASKALVWEWDIDSGSVRVDQDSTGLFAPGTGAEHHAILELEQHVHSGDIDRLRHAQRDCLKGIAPDFAQEYRVSTGNGNWAWVLSRGQVVERDAGGRARRMTGITIDVTERKRAELELRRSQQRFEKMFDAIPAATVIVRYDDGVLLEANRAAQELFGYGRDELIGQDALSLNLWQDPRDRARLMSSLQSGEPVNLRPATIRRRSGELRDMLLSAAWVDVEGEKQFLSSAVDITDIKRAEELLRQSEERIRHLATRDPLTGLPNRLLLNDLLARGIGSAQRNRGSLAVMVVDLDRFKYINDTLGHAVGDAFLTAVARRIAGAIPKGDMLARLGSDEFVVLLESFGPMEDLAGQVARAILASLREPIHVEGHALTCTCSIGISVLPADGDEPHVLLRKADTAMHYVKENGRGSYRYFSEEMNLRMADRLHLEIALRGAVHDRQFEVVYQPKVNVASGRITGLEALLRWRHPDMGIVSPARFIAVAEETGLIVEIGRWVLEEVCRQLQAWGIKGLNPVPVSVNLSVRQFTPELAEQFAAVLGQYGVEPSLIELEITESLFMRNPREVGAVLESFAQRGMRVALDDFGTGYSSLSYLRQFRVDALKIDRSFLSDIGASSQNIAIVRAVIMMCSGLGMRVIAEGVETRAQLEILRALRCDEYQGYFYSPPLPPEDVERRCLEGACRE